MPTIQRITGVNSGLDVDTLVKSAMTPYTARIDKETQNRKVLEYQQEQYKQIMSDASDFYDKYLDILKSGNLRTSSSYETQKIESTDPTKVTAKGFAGSSIDNYAITVTQLAAKATDSLTSGETGNAKITIGTAEVKFMASSDGNKTVTNYNEAVAAKKTELTNLIKATTDETEKANLQTQLSDLNNNAVTAKYSEFSKSVTFTASAFGGKGFTLSNDGGNIGAHVKTEDKYLEATIKNSSGQIYTISEADKKTSNNITIDGVQFSFKGVNASNTVNQPAPTDPIHDSAEIAIVADVNDASDLVALTALDENGTTQTSTATDGTKTTVTTSGSITTTRVTTQSGDTTITTEDSSTNKKTIVAANGNITTTQTDVGADKDAITTITAGSTITTTRTKADGTIPITRITETSGSTTTTLTTLKDGTKSTLIKETVNGTTKTKTTTTEEQLTDGTKTTIREYSGNPLEVSKTTTTQIKVVDGVTTKTVTTDNGTTQDVTTYDSPTSLTSSPNITDLKDKIVKFVNDYNTLLKSINTKLFEKRDKDYMPLTDDQKKEMTEDQITAWETKAKTGLLRRDSDLERIVGQMKSAMSTVMSGTGSYLEKIGITPVKDYSDKNGMFTIDEDKLTQALEEDAGNVKDLFTRVASTTDTNDKGGILTKLAATLKSEFKTSTASLAKKAGLIGSSTEYDNNLTKSINDKTTLIKKLNSQLSTKETALYKKYSDLETIMGKLNSQQSSLISMLGQG